MFSVVIPLYNKGHTILRTLSSVLNQTFVEFEVLIINDGSTDDGVFKILDSIFDSRIRVIDKVNQGVSAARNTGVEHSRYEYIAFLDGDDVWLPDYLFKMNEAIVLFGDSELFCSAGYGGNFVGTIITNRQIDKYRGQVLAIDFFENPHLFLHISSSVVTKNLFYKVDGFSVGMRRNEDFAFLYSAALFTKVIYSGFNTIIYMGGVEGQATGENIYRDTTLLLDIIKRYDISFENWMKSGSRNKSFIIFMKYELRHTFMINIYNNEFNTNILFLEKLKPEILGYFNFLDLFFLKNSHLKMIGILYFKFSKIKWLLQGYQRVK